MTTLDGSVQQTAEGGYVVAFDRRIERPPARVWAALTDVQILRNWLGEVELDLRVGGSYIIRFRKIPVVMTGRITALEPGHLLEYTWQENHGMPASRVRWEVQPAAGGCRLRLAHTFPVECVLKEIVSFAGGWHAFFNAIPSAADGQFVEDISVESSLSGNLHIASVIPGTCSHRVIHLMRSQHTPSPI